MQIERNIIKDLLEWKNSSRRKPLLLKGVRQCGKTWILKYFGKKHFTNAAEFNFDKDASLKSFFSRNVQCAENHFSIERLQWTEDCPAGDPSHF